MKKTTLQLTTSAVCLALCMLLPMLTGQIPQIGNALCPMHLPVLLCGFLCGWPYGLLVGFLAPLLRFVLFQMPPILPTGISMAFELATYGAVSGLLYQHMKKKTVNLYLSLIVAMISGRVVWGVVRWAMASVTTYPFSLEAFVDGALVTAIPGIVIQILLVPVLVFALTKSGLGINEPRRKAGQA